MSGLPFEYAVRNLGRDTQRLAASVSGSALVVLLVIAAAAFVNGMNRTLRPAGGQCNVLLLGAGSEESVERSEIDPAAAQLAASSIPGIRTRLGEAYVSPEIHHAALAAAEPGGSGGHLAVLRGVTPAAFLVHRQVRIVAGRAPGPGEVLVGRMAAVKMGLPEAQLAVGRSLWIDRQEYKIAGRFEAPQTVLEAEVWIPLQELQLATKRTGLSCVVLTMDKPDFADVDAFCKRRMDLELVSIAEDDYYARVQALYRPVQAVVWLTAGLIALAGLFGGLNTMYAAFASRVRELGSLQALGFSRRAIVFSLMQEALLAASAGTLLAALAAVLLLDGRAVRISMGAFGLHVDAAALCAGLAAGLALGLLGALPAAWRCLRLPIAEALKST